MRRVMASWSLLMITACGRVGFNDVAPADVAIDVATDGGTQPVADAGDDQVVTFVPGGTSITINPLASYDPNGTLVSCVVEWASGSTTGNSCTSLLGLVVYIPGIYPVALTVIDNDGQVASVTVTITVLAQGISPPLDGLSRIDVGGDKVATVGTPLVFDFSRSWNSDGRNYSGFSYDFGDGVAGGSNALPSVHTYAAAGTYPVTYKLENFTIPISMWPTDAITVTVN